MNLNQVLGHNNISKAIVKVLQIFLYRTIFYRTKSLLKEFY